MLISGFSVFIALYNRLRERKYELALMRSMGCSRARLFWMLLSEGMLLALTGFAGGLLLSRFGLWILNTGAAREFHFGFSYEPVQGELWLLATYCTGGGRSGSPCACCQCFQDESFACARGRVNLVTMNKYNYCLLISLTDSLTGGRQTECTEYPARESVVVHPFFHSAGWNVEAQSGAAISVIHRSGEATGREDGFCGGIRYSA
jgi:hypothetical protein